MITGLSLYKKRWNIKTNNGVQPGLDAISSALAELNHPHQSGQFIHIAGTNGKGSTAAFLHAILRQHGKSVGSFFSPCIEDLHDQIQIDGNPVSKEEMDAAMEKIAGIQTPLTDFELLTAAAFLIFEKAAPDFTIIEAGMGGRFDSTNVIDPIISLIPSISLEHTNFLGDTIEEIAWHKAGIIKKWKPVVIGPVPAEAENVFRQTADNMHSDLIEATEPVNLELKLRGKHQQINAALAMEAAKEILHQDFNQQKADKGISEARMPNRFEEIYPNLIFDGAHNEASIEALVETIKTEYPGRKVHIVLGLLKDKDYPSILRKLETISDHFTFIDFENERALSAEILFKENRSKIKTILKECDILPLSNKNDMTIVTGSLYLLAGMRSNNFAMFREYIPH